MKEISKKLGSISELPGNGEYIFSVRNYQDLEGLTIGADDIDCLTLDATGGVFDLKNKGVYQFRITIEDNSTSITVPINIERESTDQTTLRVEVDPIQMVDTNKGVFSFFKGTDVNTFINELTDMAQVNGKNAFNYFYTPNPNNEIDDPLEASSFNNHNHFYNKFTICKVRDYNIVGKSNIFVNN